MHAKLEQILEETKELTANERAALAHCLISNLENRHDEDVDAAWASIVDASTRQP